MDAFQGSVIEECRIPNAGDDRWKRDGLQAGADIERPSPDGGDAAGGCVASGFAAWTLDECVRALVEQNAVHSAVKWVEHVHRYRAQVGAGIERLRSNRCDSLWDRDTRQVGAAGEPTASYRGDAARDDVAS